MLITICHFVMAQSNSQLNSLPSDSKFHEPSGTKKFYRLGEHAWAKMRDGTESEVVIVGKESKNRYWVRRYKSKKKGLIHKKFLRPKSPKLKNTKAED